MNYKLNAAVDRFYLHIYNLLKNLSLLCRQETTILKQLVNNG